MIKLKHKKSLLMVLILIVLFIKVGLSLCRDLEYKDIKVKVTGVVKDKISGKPIVGAKINAYLHYDFVNSTVTGEDGSYTLLANVKVWVEADWRTLDLYVVYDDPKTAGVDYVPTYEWMKFYTNTSYVEKTVNFTLIPAASIKLVGYFFFPNFSEPCKTRFVVVWVSEENLGKIIYTYGYESSFYHELRDLGINACVTVVPANIPVNIKVCLYLWEYSFTIFDDYVVFNQGDFMSINYTAKSLEFSIDYIRGILTFTEDLISEAESRGFRVQSFRDELNEAKLLFDDAIVAFESGDYELCHRKLMEVRLIANDVISKLKGYTVGLIISLTLTSCVWSLIVIILSVILLRNNLLRQVLSYFGSIVAFLIFRNLNYVPNEVFLFLLILFLTPPLTYTLLNLSLMILGIKNLDYLSQRMVKLLQVKLSSK